MIQPTMKQTFSVEGQQLKQLKSDRGEEEMSHAQAFAAAQTNKGPTKTQSRLFNVVLKVSRGVCTSAGSWGAAVGLQASESRLFGYKQPHRQRCVDVRGEMTQQSHF